MKKRRKNEDMEYISPNNLIVPSWEWPVPKREKRISIISAIVFVICVVFMIVYGKIETSSSVIEFLWFIIVFATPMSLMLSLVAPVTFLTNKFLRIVKNAEAEEEMRQREAEKEMSEKEKPRKIGPSECI